MGNSFVAVVSIFSSWSKVWGLPNSSYFVECSAARHVECSPAAARGASAALIVENPLWLCEKNQTQTQTQSHTQTISGSLRCASWGVRACGLRGRISCADWGEASAALRDSNPNPNSNYFVECSAARHVEYLPPAVRGGSAALNGEIALLLCEKTQTHTEPQTQTTSTQKPNRSKQIYKD